MNKKQYLAAFGTGLLFAFGLALSGMTLPSKVIGFFDFSGQLRIVDGLFVHEVGRVDAYRLIRHGGVDANDIALANDGVVVERSGTLDLRGGPTGAAPGDGGLFLSGARSELCQPPTGDRNYAGLRSGDFSRHDPDRHRVLSGNTSAEAKANARRRHLRVDHRHNDSWQGHYFRLGGSEFAA